MLAAACLSVLALLLLLLGPLQTSTTATSHWNASAVKQDVNLEKGASISVHETSSSSLYKCELSYLQMDTSLIKFSINHLIIVTDELSEAPGKVIVAGGDNFLLDEINYDASFNDLKTRTQLDPSLPFIFFINGFNTLNQCKVSLGGFPA